MKNQRGAFFSFGKPHFHLGWHLVLVLLLKIVLLGILWHAFIKPYKVTVTETSMGTRMAGSPHQPYQENRHD